jgi:hypothetical protein
MSSSHSHSAQERFLHGDLTVPLDDHLLSRGGRGAQEQREASEARAEHAALVHDKAPPPKDAEHMAPFKEGDRVFFSSHEGHTDVGVVQSDLGPSRALFGSNLHTREGRNEHAEEHLYVVQDERNGEVRTYLAGALRLADSMGSSRNMIHPSGAVEGKEVPRQRPHRK